MRTLFRNLAIMVLAPLVFASVASAQYDVNGNFHVRGNILSGPTVPAVPNTNYTVSPRLVSVGNLPASLGTTYADATPVVTEIYVGEIFVPTMMTATGVALLNGAAVTDDVKVCLYNSAGVPVANNGAGLTQAGADVYQAFPFSSVVTLTGPATYYIGIIFDGTTSRYQTHTTGSFGAGEITGQTYAAGCNVTITPPTTFTTILAPIANLY